MYRSSQLVAVVAAAVGVAALEVSAAPFWVHVVGGVLVFGVLMWLIDRAG